MKTTAATRGNTNAHPIPFTTSAPQVGKQHNVATVHCQALYRLLNCSSSDRSRSSAASSLLNSDSCCDIPLSLIDQAVKTCNGPVFASYQLTYCPSLIG